MFNQFDVTMKTLLSAAPSSWLKLAGIEVADMELIEDKDLQFEETDLSTVTTTCDKLLRFRAGIPDLYHIEFESEGKNVPRRVLRYNVLAFYKYNVPVNSIVFLMRRAADRKDITGRLELINSEGFKYHDFHYRVVRVWLIPFEQILASGIGILPLALVADVEESELPGLVLRVQERADVELDAEGRDLLWTIAYLLLGLNYPKDFIENLLKGKDHMRNSSTYLGILEEGEKIGIEKGEKIGIEIGEKIGIEIGEERALKNTILRIGELRFGAPTQEIIDRVQAIHSVETLSTLTERLVSVESWEEFFLKFPQAG